MTNDLLRRIVEIRAMDHPVQGLLGLLGLLENQPNWAHRDCYVLDEHRTKQIVSGCFSKQWINSMHVNHVVAGSFLSGSEAAALQPPNFIPASNSNKRPIRSNYV